MNTEISYSNNATIKVLHSSSFKVLGSVGRASAVVMPLSAKEKAAAACISHKEAERRRRQRINGHIATLRTLLPNLLKNDKASLLSEAVHRMKELKKSTTQLIPSSTNGTTAVVLGEERLLPTDTDEVQIRRCHVDVGIIVATLCCEDRTDLLSNLSRALRSVKSKVIRVQIATVGGRVKIVMHLQHGCNDNGGVREAIGALSRALQVVVDTQAVSAFGHSMGKRQRHYY